MADKPTSTEPESGAPATETRRTRLRRELTEEILRVARQQLTAAGPGGVSWRGIAREVGMNPASLYTYFDNVDDLFTALIMESYGSLAHEVQDAYENSPLDDPLERAMTCVRAYADWARSRPAEFNLIFVDQLPGYAAPEGGPTIDAEMAVLRPLISAGAALSGRLADPEDVDTADPRDVDDSIGVWALLHGLVSLEINNHVPIPDQADRFERLMRDALGRLVR